MNTLSSESHLDVACDGVSDQLHRCDQEAAGQHQARGHLVVEPGHDGQQLAVSRVLTQLT